METNYARKMIKVYRIVKSAMKVAPYHNFSHARDVFSVAKELSFLENIGLHQRFLLGTSALLHDVIYEVGAKDNEDRSAEFAQHILPDIVYCQNDIVVAKNLILATKLPTNPKNILEAIICDADLDNLGRDDFFEKLELVGQESGISREENYLRSLDFLKKHRYYTNSAKLRREEGLKKNIKKLEELCSGG